MQSLCVGVLLARSNLAKGLSFILEARIALEAEAPAAVHEPVRDGVDSW
jgi:hypothetical protein